MSECVSLQQADSSSASGQQQESSVSSQSEASTSSQLGGADSSSASGQQQESSVSSQSEASTSSQLGGADSSSASGQQQESSVSSQSEASTSSQLGGADSSSASGQQQESSVSSQSEASTSSQLGGADSSSASGQQQESSVSSQSEASTSSQLGGADSSSASGQQQESSVSSQSEASTSSQLGTDWRREMRSKVASVEYILAARALISVGVYAAQGEIARSRGCAPLRVAEVEEIVRDGLVRSHFHDSGLSLGSIRLVLMQVGDKLGLQGLKIGEGYATYLAQAFADSVVVAADVQSSGACPTGLDSAIASVETSWSLHGGLVRKDFDRDTKVERGDLEAFVDFMFGGVSYDDGNASAARSVLETLAGHVDALGISYNQLDRLDADTLYSVVSFSAASAIDRGAVSDAADKFRVMMFGGAPAGQEKTAEPEHEAATPSASSVLSTVHGKVVDAVDRAKEAAQQAYAGVRKRYVAKPSDTTTQLVVAITALLITAFAICACLEPRLIGASGPLIWGCLALVALLPLLGMAVHTAVSASSQKKAAGGAQRVAAQERSRELSRARQEDQQKLHVPAILTGLSVLVFIAAVVACIAVDARRGTWQGSICFLAAFVLFAISAAVVMATRDQSLAEECDSKCATARTAQAVPGGQQQPRATEGVVSGGGQEGGAGVPGTSVPSAGSGSVPPATVMVSVDPQLVATLGAGAAQAAA
uniref:Surface antigen AmI95 n=1 Tax=Anaplasma marginale TaxID=770 RepID=Q44098_ANAMA|nr:surface antigen AmI95 [Anaplasma marginale]